MAVLLWSSKKDNPRGVAVCPYCHSVTGFEVEDLDNPKKITKYRGGIRVEAGFRGLLKCTNQDCQKQFEAECK